VEHPERFINWLVGRYSPAPERAAVGASPNPGTGRSKYEPLRRYLADRSEPAVAMTFTQIERILGRGLPASARRYRPWWANESAGTHIHARAWLDAGRRSTNVDLNAGTVEFVSRSTSQT
jgi:hypothetical protein